MKKIKIYLDLDGVIANWLKGGCELMNIPLPKETEILEYNWLYTVCSEKDIFDKLENNEQFWIDLKKFYWSDLLVLQLEKHFPNQWRFLSKVPKNLSAYSGKAKWIQKNFTPFMDRLILCADCKSFFANKDSVLIDDNPKSIELFNKAGGHGFLWSELNGKNNTMTEINNRIFELIEFIKKIK